MKSILTVALVGIGGYGKHHVNAVLDAKPDRRIRLVGTIDPTPQNCHRWEELQKLNAPHFASLEDFYRNHTADLVAIASPIQFHADQVCLALERGSHVFCEKPLCATPQDAQRMIDAEARSKRHAAIGYQWSFSGAIQELKADVLSGRFGRPKRFRCLTLWPRDETYYGRNGWAGGLHDASGRAIFDSPVNNACAHQLHNMLYVLGDRVFASAQPTGVEAELFRANDIPNYDTAALRCRTSAGVDVYFYATHACRSRFGPVFSYEFENAVVEYADAPNAIIKATFKSGSTICYGSPDEPRDRKLWVTIDAIRRQAPSLCPPEAAAAHTRAVAMAQEAAGAIIDFPRRLIRRVGPAGERVTLVQGLESALKTCYANCTLPSEAGYAWAMPGKQRRGRGREVAA